MTPCLGPPDTAAPAPERRTAATLPPSLMQVREASWCSLVADEVKGRAWPSIEGEQRQLLDESGGYRTSYRWCCWLWWLHIVDWVRLCT